MERADARCYNSDSIKKPGHKVKGKMAAADASPLIMPPTEFEPAHAGCYTFLLPQGQRGAWLGARKLEFKL